MSVNEIIKVLNIDKAFELINSGFKYTIEILEGKTIYVFIANDSLIKYINNNFNKHDFFIDKTMNF
jgi:hypothetical protein